MYMHGIRLCLWGFEDNGLYFVLRDILFKINEIILKTKQADNQPKKKMIQKYSQSESEIFFGFVQN